MRRAVAFGVGLVFVAVAALPASAATVTVEMTDTKVFKPSLLTAAMGTTVKWQNTGIALPHTATQNAPLSKWDTGNVAPAESSSKTIRWAGSFGYHCEYHGTATSGMRGVVRIPVIASPAAGTVGTTFTIKVATASAPTGFVYDVQKKVGDGTWQGWRKGITNSTTNFKPQADGTYSFRSRLRRTSNNGASGYSPAATVVVTAA